MDNENKKCVLCKKELAENEKVLFIKDVENEIFCEICKNHINIIKNSAYEKDKIESVKHLNKYMATCGNSKAIKYLKNIINNNTSPLISQKEINNHEQSILPQNTSSGWIKGLKIGAWITVVVIIIYGIVTGLAAFEEDAMTGIIIIIVSPITAFSAVALIMVFLDMAEDIKAIRNNTQNKEK